MRQCDPIGLVKAILWEEAKGKLRAIAMAQGSRLPGPVGEIGEASFEPIQSYIEKFIRKFEYKGYHE